MQFFFHELLFMTVGPQIQMLYDLEILLIIVNEFFLG